jgi:hypothetical protein
MIPVSFQFLFPCTTKLLLPLLALLGSIGLCILFTLQRLRSDGLPHESFYNFDFTSLAITNGDPDTARDVTGERETEDDGREDLLELQSGHQRIVLSRILRRSSTHITMIRNGPGS